MGKGKHRQIKTNTRNKAINVRNHDYLLCWEATAYDQARDIAYENNIWDQKKIWRLAEVLLYDVEFNMWEQDDEIIVNAVNMIKNKY